MIAVDALADLHAKWEAGTLTEAERDELIEGSAEVFS